MRKGAFNAYTFLTINTDLTKAGNTIAGADLAVLFDIPTLKGKVQYTVLESFIRKLRYRVRKLNNLLHGRGLHITELSGKTVPDFRVEKLDADHPYTKYSAALARRATARNYTMRTGITMHAGKWTKMSATEIHLLTRVIYK